MARGDDRAKPAEDAPAGGLRHNPFAALRGRMGDLPPGPAPDAAAPSANPGAERAPAGRVVVRRERKGHGGKAVTVVEGPGLAGQDLAALAREAARALGAGARVEGGALVVQGDQADRVAAWLTARGLGPVTRGN